MIYIFLSACCSVTVSALLKLAARFRIGIIAAITWNYSMAVILTCFFYLPSLESIHTAPGYIYTLLGILLPSLFLVLATAVKFAGIVRTDIAQRLSLLIPLLVSFLVLHEPLTLLKTTGILVGMIAILALIPWQRQNNGSESKSSAWIYLLIVFIGMGVIDILFRQMAVIKGVTFTASLLVTYALSFIVSMSILLARILAKKDRFSFRDMLFGWGVGVANFGNILFYLLAHKALANRPSTVFSAMNIGVIALGALVGFLIFKEKLSSLNKIGIALAIIAVLIIAYA